MPQQGRLTYEELKSSIEAQVPEWIEVDQAVEGVILALVPPSERTLPIIKNPFREQSLYAWSNDDASAVKLALELLSHLGQGLLSGPAGLVHLGLAVKEIVCFLIDLKRNSVEIIDPLQIKVLVLLHDDHGGLSVQQLRSKLGGSPPVPSSQIDSALKGLANADADGRPKPLVRADAGKWKCLV